MTESVINDSCRIDYHPPDDDCIVILVIDYNNRNIEKDTIPLFILTVTTGDNRKEDAGLVLP